MKFSGKEDLDMLMNWVPARMPEKDEMKSRLSTARKQLYDLQMKIK